MVKKIIRNIILALTALSFSTSPVLAHVSVTPDKAGVSSRVDFSVGVPNEKDIPTTQLRLVIPEGLQGVTPFVKPGWNIEAKKSGEGEEAVVTEIVWKDGQIPQGLRDAFVLRAMVPANPTTLVWKAYQTYQDGTVVAWELPANEEENEGVNGPYSKTEIVDDLTQEPAVSMSIYEQLSSVIAPLALLLSLLSLVLLMRKGKVN